MGYRLNRATVCVLGKPWLTFTPTEGVTPSTLSVSVDPLIPALYTGAGNYPARIEVLNSEAAVLGIPVALTILPATLAAVPSSLVFSVQAGASTTVTQTLAVGGMGWTVPFKVVASGGAWLSSSSVSGNSVCVSNGVLCTPATVSVTVNPNGLSPGTYIGMISITPTGGNITSVPVTFTVVPAPTVTASPTSLSFTYQVPGSAPLPATLQVSGSVSGSAFSVTTATQTGGNWLSVTPTTGLTPSTVSVLASPAGLPPGNYSGSVTVTGANGATGTTIINVSLIVVAVPTVTAVVNAASFQAGAVAPGELISIGGAANRPNRAGGARFGLER